MTRNQLVAELQKLPYDCDVTVEVCCEGYVTNENIAEVQFTPAGVIILESSE